MIETYGVIGSIEATDAMLKASDVRLVKQEFIDGGIVTIVIEGDVGAVQAAVDAGKEAANRVSKVLASHVIPRTTEDVQKIILSSLNVEAKSNVKPIKPSTRKVQPTEAIEPKTEPK